MAPNDSDIELIYYSWGILSSNPQAMMRFYDHLFDIAPETRHFFPDDISKQSEKLTYTIGFMIENLKKLESIQSSIEDLGRFHNKLQIEAYHYEKLKVALVRAVEENMGELYSQDIGRAWNHVLDYVSDVMINAPVKSGSTTWKRINRFFG